MGFEFEWDDVKNVANNNKHGVDFMDAVRVFYDEARIIMYVDRKDYGEDRFQVIGMSYGTVNKTSSKHLSLIS